MSKPLSAKGRSLGVGLHPFELDTALRGDAAPGVEELGCQIARGDDRSCGGRLDRGIARACGDVQNMVARPNPARANEFGTELGNQLRRDCGIVAGCPQGTMLRLEFTVGFDGGHLIHSFTSLVILTLTA